MNGRLLLCSAAAWLALAATPLAWAGNDADDDGNEAAQGEKAAPARPDDQADQADQADQTGQGDKTDKDSKAAKVRKAEKEQEEHGPWTVKVPKRLRGQGYALRIDGDLIPLDHDKITLRGEDNRQRVELVDRGGRVMSDETVYVDQYIFDFADARHYRVNVLFGGTALNGKPLRRLLQDNQLSEQSIDFDYQPNAFGLRLSYSNLESDESRTVANGPSIKSTYNSYQFRALGLYEIAPFAASDGAVRRLHAVFSLGLLSAVHRIEVTDDIVTIRDKATSLGPVAGLDLMYPIHSFWIELRGYASYQKIEFKKFDLKEHLVERGAQIGGGYAF